MDTVELFGYDYKRQAWYDGGVYVRCGHPDSMGCECYGRLNEGKSVIVEALEPWLYSVKLPRAFFADHASRCITRDVVTRSTSKGIIVDLEAREVANLLNDADHWSTEWRELGQAEGFGLGSSARATAAAIRRQFDAETREEFRQEWHKFEKGLN